MPVASGTFEVTSQLEPPFDEADGVALGRARFEKRFSGDISATSVAHMIGVRTPVEGSAGYVAIERVVGALSGRSGSFVLQHSGSMQGGSSSLSVSVVPGSGTGQLSGITGQMSIRITGGVHHYELSYELPA